MVCTRVKDGLKFRLSFWLDSKTVKILLLKEGRNFSPSFLPQLVCDSQYDIFRTRYVYTTFDASFYFRPRMLAAFTRSVRGTTKLKQQPWCVVVERKQKFPSFFSVPAEIAVKTRQHLSQQLTSARDVMFQFILDVDFPTEMIQTSDGVTTANMVGLLLHFNE